VFRLFPLFHEAPHQEVSHSHMESSRQSACRDKKNGFALKVFHIEKVLQQNSFHGK